MIIHLEAPEVGLPNPAYSEHPRKWIDANVKPVCKKLGPWRLL